MIYVRLSRYRGAQDDPSTSPERQRADCEAYCQAQGWDVMDVVEDLDVSGFLHGKRLERPGIRRVIALLPDVDRVVFLKIDRLARSVTDFHQLAELAREHNAALVSVKDNIDLSTPTGRMLVTMLSAFAELESATIGERVRDARAYLKTVGRWTGGQVPTGYRVVPHPDGKGKALDVDPLWAVEIRRAAVDHLDRNVSTYAITARWNGLRTDGKRYDEVNVIRVLTGDAVSGRSGWPPILDPTTVLRLRAKYPPKAVKEHMPPRTEHKAKASRLLSGVLRCHTCGGKLTVGGNVRQVDYACREPSCPRKVSVVAERADRLLEEYFLQEFGDVALAEPVRQAVDADREALLMAEIALLSAEIPTAGREQGRSLFAQVEALKDELEEVQSAPTEFHIHYRTGEPYAVQWEQAEDVHARRRLLRKEIDRIVLRPVGRGYNRLTLDRFDIRLLDESAEEVPEEDRLYRTPGVVLPVAPRASISG